jgi:pimeloyl-ACP methyl ester carboxylesterase
VASNSDLNYRPVRPPLSARWTEWGALLRPSPEILEFETDDTFRRAANAAGTVLVLPGLARGDSQTVRLRSYLNGLGFNVQGWGLGVDIGPTRRVLDGLEALLTKTASSCGPVNLVGLSMGGLFARWMAQRQPASVRQVISICSPFRSPLDSFFLPLRPVAPLWPCDVSAFLEVVGRPLPVPTTCLYTTTDGTVAWGSCLDPQIPEDCLEFKGEHVTMASNPIVWSLVAKRLVRPLI